MFRTQQNPMEEAVGMLPTSLLLIMVQLETLANAPHPQSRQPPTTS